LEKEESGKRSEHFENLSEILGLVSLREIAEANNFVYDRCDMPTMTFARFFQNYIDYIIVPWTELMLMNRIELKKRINYFKNFVKGIFSSGETIEKAVIRKAEIKTIKYLFDLGLTGIGLRESPFIPRGKLLHLIKLIKTLKLKTFVKMFNVYPEDVISRVREYIAAGADYIIIPLVPYEYPNIALDERLNIKWEALYDIVDEIGHQRVVFQVGDKAKMMEIFYVFGRYINVLTDKFSKIIDVELLRARASRMLENISFILRSLEGTVSMKFVYFVLATEGPMDVRRISEKTRLPLKTVQDSLRNLRKIGYVKSISKPENRRRVIWIAVVPEI